MPAPPADAPKRKRGRPPGSRNRIKATNPPPPSVPAPPSSSTAPPPPIPFTFDAGVSLLLTAIALPLTAALSAYAETISQQLQHATPSPPKHQKTSHAPSPVPPTLPPSTPRRRPGRPKKVVPPPSHPLPSPPPPPPVDDSETEDEDDGLPSTSVSPAQPPPDSRISDQLPAGMHFFPRHVPPSPAGPTPIKRQLSSRI